MFDEFDEQAKIDNANFINEKEGADDNINSNNVQSIDESETVNLFEGINDEKVETVQNSDFVLVNNLSETSINNNFKEANTEPVNKSTVNAYTEQVNEPQNNSTYTYSNTNLPYNNPVYTNNITNSANATNNTNYNYSNSNVTNQDSAKKKTFKKKTIYILIGAALTLTLLVIALVGISGGFSKSNNTQEVASITVGPVDESKKNENSTANTSGTSSDSSKGIATAVVSENDGDTVAEVVENVMPAIVTINCKVLSTTMDFFGRTYQDEAEGSGSGIIIGQNDNQILIATNNHVVDGATEVSVVFCDEKEAIAQVKGTDSYADLAVIAIDLKDIDSSTLESIKIASLGNSENCKVGEMAIAIGNALGYGQSVTVGVISAVNREISLEDSTMTLLQTDAAINPGNSGGALINSKGEVIGINSVKYVSEDTEGMGYAIPISDAIPIINDLMNYEEIPDNEKGYFGIKGQDISEEYASRYSAYEGIAVSEVSSESPAEKAGILRGDIIVKFDGREVTTMDELQDILQKKKGGSECEVVIYRYSEGEYKELNLTVTLGSRGDYD